MRWSCKMYTNENNMFLKMDFETKDWLNIIFLFDTDRNLIIQTKCIVKLVVFD
jgi:hypothetical protein